MQTIGDVDGVFPRDPRFLLMAAAAAVGLALLPIYTVPLVLGALIDQRGYDPSDAGFLVSAEAFALAITTVILSPKVGAWPWRRLVEFAGVLIVLGNTSSILVTGYLPLLSSRMAVGVGGGIIYAVGNAAIAASWHRARHYASTLGFSVLCGSAGLLFVPYAMVAVGVPGAFGTLLAISVLLLPVVWLLPLRGPATSAQHRKGDGGNSIAGWLLLLAALLLGLGQGAFFGFIERMGLHTGLSSTDVGQILSLTNLAGLVGAGLAVWLAVRVGYLWPICVGAIINGICIFVIAGTDSAWVYTIVLTIELVSLFFFTPFVTALGATLSPGGKWATAEAGTIQIGNGVGPSVGAMILTASTYTMVGHSEYATIGAFVVLANLIAMLLCLAVPYFADRAHRKAAVPQAA